MNSWRLTIFSFYLVFHAVPAANEDGDAPAVGNNVVPPAIQPGFGDGPVVPSNGDAPAAGNNVVPPTMQPGIGNDPVVAPVDDNAEDNHFGLSPFDLGLEHSEPSPLMYLSFYESVMQINNDYILTYGCSLFADLVKREM
jgi:hypothetical protein